MRVSAEDAVRTASEALSSLVARAVASAPGPEDVEEIRRSKSVVKDVVGTLKQRIYAGEEVMEQLKLVIRAQHAKIEELRQEVACRISAGVQLQLLDDSKKMKALSAEVTSNLQAQVTRLSNQARDLKASNADLRRVNTRYAAMLDHVGSGGGPPSDSLLQPLKDMAGASVPVSSPLPPPPPSSVSPWRAEEGHVAMSPTSAPAPGLEPPSPLAAAAAAAAAQSPTGRRAEHRPFAIDTFASPRPSPSGASRRSSGMDLAIGGGGGGGSHFAQPVGPPTAMPRGLVRAAKASQALWHEAGPRGLIRAFLHGAAHVLEGLKAVTATLYVADPWLWRTMTEPSDSDNTGVYSDYNSQLLNPSVFYLNGKVALHAIRRDGMRPEAPRFIEMAQLPILGSATVMALPLQANRRSGGAMAALQVTLGAPVASGGGGGGGLAASASAVSLASAASGGGAGAEGASTALGLTPAQVAGLQLLCANTAGILDMHRRCHVMQALQKRARSCLKVAEEVSRATTIIDFEAKAKPLIAQLFNVARVRISFYDKNTDELLTTTILGHRVHSNLSGKTPAAPPVSAAAAAAAVGRRRVERFAAEDGITGRCAKRKAIVHLDRLLASPIINELADGVDLNDAAAVDVNMLCGPMLASFTDGSVECMGVVQLLQKTKRSADDPLYEADGGGGGGGLSRRNGLPGAGGAVPQSVICDRFTSEDEDVFTQLLNILGLVLWKTIQAQRLDVPGQNRGQGLVERLLASL